MIQYKIKKTYKINIKNKNKSISIGKSKYKNKNRMSRKNTRKIYGGSIIGQGNYGCVFKPEIIKRNNFIYNSIKTNDDNIVSKVVLKNNAFSEYRHEYKILKKLRDIDPKGDFHSLLMDAFEFKKEDIPDDFLKCSLTKPQYSPDDFFVFNILFCGKYNLLYYLTHTFDKNKDKKVIPDPAILFTLLTNIFIGIKKMISSNILHKTLDASSIYLKEPVTLDNPYTAKIIDYGDGELRKYKGFNDKNRDYITLFNSIIKILTELSSQQYDISYNKIIEELLYGFNELKSMVEKNNISYKELIKSYILLLKNTFGEKYSKYALNKYKL